MSETFEKVKHLLAEDKLIFSEHCVEELEEDGLFPEDVFETIDTAVVVEDYPDAWKGPSVLVRQTLRSGAHVHVLWGTSKANPGTAVVITAYRLDPLKWSTDGLKRIL